jgi:hypothetical protein
MKNLHPAVMEHFGHMGQGLCVLIRSVHQQSDLFQRAWLVDEAYQTMATDLQRTNITLLAAAGEFKCGSRLGRYCSIYLPYPPHSPPFLLAAAFLLVPLGLCVVLRFRLKGFAEPLG